MKATIDYVKNNEVINELVDKPETCWGSGVVVGGKHMNAYAWAKVIYVAVHLSPLNFDIHVSTILQSF